MTKPRFAPASVLSLAYRWAGSFALVGCFAVLGPGCKRDKKPDYDRSSPRKLMESFQLALSKGRIPRDTLDFFLAEREYISWKLRCKDRGCTRAQFKVTKVVREDAYAAEYMVQFAVFGRKNNRIMGGVRPLRVTFAKSGDFWFFDELGRSTTIHVGVPIDAGTESEKPKPRSQTDSGPAPDPR